MKTDEQILLAYMYARGYTDEDMFDDKTMNKVRNSLEFCLHRFNLGFHKIVGAFKVFADGVVEIWSNVIEQVPEIWPVIKGVTLTELELPDYKTFTPINFSKRPQIRHQVTDRKPKHLTRKIIY